MLGAGAFLPNPVALTDGASLALFTGGSTIDLTVQTANFSLTDVCHIQPSSSGFCHGSLFLSWAGEIEVTYQFIPAVTATPEPATLALLAGGAGWLGLLRRRR